MTRANSYNCYPDFVIRTPLYPLDFIDTIPSEPNELRGFVKEQWKDPLIKGAILLASPSLSEQLNFEIEKNSLPDKLVNSFLRYLIRLCSRSTPFGMFAGVATGVISGNTKLELNKPEDNMLGSRLDMEYLGARVMKLIADPKTRKELLFQANTSLYQLGSKWRYIEVFFNKDSRKKYRIVAIDRNQILDEIITASGNYRGMETVIQQLTAMGYQEDEAMEFMHELIDSQVLIPDIFPNLTGQEFSTRLRSRLEHLPQKLPGSSDFLALMDRISITKKPESLSESYTEISDLAGGVGDVYNLAHLVQADMLTSFKCAEITFEISNQVLMGIRILKSLSNRRVNKVLQNFKMHFEERFGTQEIPLPLVMDSEFGVGLSGPEGQQMTDPSPLLDGLDFQIGTEHDLPDSPHPLLLKKLKSFSDKDSPYIDLDKNDIRELGIRKGKWPEQMYAMFRLAEYSGKPALVFDLASSGNPAPILGRFDFLSEETKLNKHIEEMTKDDIWSHPDHILAEIVHLPEDRTGNILQRPSYYNWEIPYLATQGNQADVISPNEILVSLVNNEVVLKHKSSGKTILPRLTNAHNYRSRQLPLYQFLAECVNKDDNSGYFPSWGWASGVYDLLPGIRYENLVLCRPQWRIMVDEGLRKSRKRGQELYKEIISWKEKNKLPGKVIWTDGDYEIFIDWSNYNVVMSVWDSMRKKIFILFKDNPFQDGSLVNSELGIYANEVLLSFKKLAE